MAEGPFQFPVEEDVDGVSDHGHQLVVSIVFGQLWSTVYVGLWWGSLKGAGGLFLSFHCLFLDKGHLLGHDHYVIIGDGKMSTVFLKVVADVGVIRDYDAFVNNGPFYTGVLANPDPFQHYGVNYLRANLYPHVRRKDRVNYHCPTDYTARGDEAVKGHPPHSPIRQYCLDGGELFLEGTDGPVLIIKVKKGVNR